MNQASAHSTLFEEDSRRNSERAPSTSIEVRLLPKMHDPTKFKFLRPITILPTGINNYSRALHALLEPYDTEGNKAMRASESMLGFRKGCQCSELIRIVRCMVEEFTEAAMPMCKAKIDFARPYASVKHPPQG